MTEAADLIEQIKNSNDTYRKNQCRHTMPEGERCGSPAMRGEKFCYYHHGTRKPVEPHHRQARRNGFELPRPDSRAAIQDALGQIITRIGYNDIDLRRAGLLLYALQIASTNIKDHQARPKPAKQTQPSPDRAETAVIPTETEPAKKGVIPTETAQPRSGGACFSTDTACPGNLPEPAFDTEIFPPPSPHLSPIRRQTFAALLESLARHKGVEPQPGSPEDRNPNTTQPVETILPAIHAHQPESIPPSTVIRSAEHEINLHLQRYPSRNQPHAVPEARGPNVSKMSLNCHFIA